MPRKKKNPMEIAGELLESLCKPSRPKWLHGVAATLDTLIVYTWDEPTKEMEGYVAKVAPKKKFKSLKVLVEKRKKIEWYEKERSRAKRDKG